MKLYVVRSLVVAWMTVTLYVSVTLWSRTGVVDPDDMVLDVVVGRERHGRRPHAPHGSPAADPVLAHRRVVAEVKAKHLQLVNRTGWDRYFRYRAIGDRIWPTTTDERDDRILNQLHLTHQDPAGASDTPAFTLLQTKVNRTLITFRVSRRRREMYCGQNQNQNLHLFVSM